MTRSHPATGRTTQRVFYFGQSRVEGVDEGPDSLGSKGSNLVEMVSAGLPVPPGFTIVAACCGQFYDRRESLSPELIDEILEQMDMLESELDSEFASSNNPLLVSVRCGASVPVPALPSAVLNIGLNDRFAADLAATTGDLRFAFDCYCRLISTYADAVHQIEPQPFEDARQEMTRLCGVSDDAALSAESLQELCARYKAIYREHARSDFPQSPLEQLKQAIEAAYRGWTSPRASEYRKVMKLNGLLGPAVQIQSMVYGNLADDSASGIAFTRCPGTGANELTGEYLLNSQGEEVLEGTRLPIAIAEIAAWNADVYEQLLGIKHRLERDHGAVQEIGFTVQNGRTHILRSRTVSRRLNPTAAVRIAVEMTTEGLIDRETAVFSVPREHIDELNRPVFDRNAGSEAICRGYPASSGVACGKIALTRREAIWRTEAGEDVILVVREVEPDDIDGLDRARAVVTSQGGAWSHAAVIARGMGKPAVTGVAKMMIHRQSGVVDLGGLALGSGDWIGVDGGTGEVFAGKLPLVNPVPDETLTTFLAWNDEFRPLDKLPSPYVGGRPFAFICYAREDRATVLPEIARLTEAGNRIWYDAAIEPASNWKDELVKALSKCAVVVAFLTKRSANSKHVEREISFATSADTPIVPVLFETCSLSAGLTFDLQGKQMIEKHKISVQEYRRQLNGILSSLDVTRGD